MANYGGRPRKPKEPPPAGTVEKMPDVLIVRGIAGLFLFQEARDHLDAMPNAGAVFGRDPVLLDLVAEAYQQPSSGVLDDHGQGMAIRILEECDRWKPTTPAWAIANLDRLAREGTAAFAERTSAWVSERIRGGASVSHCVRELRSIFDAVGGD